MLINLRNALMAGKRWKNPYVTDGLVAMWDGEWNAGPGVHDPTATVWKEIVTGADCELTGSLETDYTWAGDSFVKLHESKGRFIFDATSSCQTAFRNASFTVEATTSQPVDTANWQAQILNICQTSQLSTYSVGIFARWRRENNGTMGNLSGAKYPSGSGVTLASADALATFSCSYNQGQFISYLDGEQKSTGSATPDSTIEGVHVRLGSVNYAFRGHYHNLRIYNRALTADEIARNYAIDKARFGLP